MPRVARLKKDPIDSEETIALGRRIAALRKKRGYTQNELAEKMDLIQSIISAHERGKIRMTSGMLIQFSSALNTTPNKLLGIESGDDPELSLRLVKRMQRIQQLPPAKQKRLLASIDDTLKANDILP